MMSAWQYAEIGPFTLSPAAQLASSETVIFWSASVVETTTQVTTPAIAMMMPTAMVVIDATRRIWVSLLPPSVRQRDATFTDTTIAYIVRPTRRVRLPHSG